MVPNTSSASSAGRCWSCCVGLLLLAAATDARRAGPLANTATHGIDDSQLQKSVAALLEEEVPLTEQQKAGVAKMAADLAKIAAPLNKWCTNEVLRAHEKKKPKTNIPENCAFMRDTYLKKCKDENARTVLQTEIPNFPQLCCDRSMNDPSIDTRFLAFTKNVLKKIACEEMQCCTFIDGGFTGKHKCIYDAANNMPQGILGPVDNGQIVNEAENKRRELKQLNPEDPALFKKQKEEILDKYSPGNYKQKRVMDGSTLNPKKNDGNVFTCNPGEETGGSKYSDSDVFGDKDGRFKLL